MPAAKPAADEARSAAAARERAARLPFVSGVILAAGLSRRMGRPKQLLELGGRPLLQHVIDAARASQLREVVLVLGHEADAVASALLQVADGPPLRLARNRDPAAGQSGSLRVALELADPRAEAAAILLGDQPGVGPGLIDRVLEAFAAAAMPAARPVWEPGDGRRIPGHPVVLHRSLWPQAMALAGDAGARTLLQAHPEWLHAIVMRGGPPADVDHWQDYLRLRDEPAR